MTVMNKDFYLEKLQKELGKAKQFHEHVTCLGTLAWRHIELARAHRKLAEKCEGELQTLHKYADRVHLDMASALARADHKSDVQVECEQALQGSENLIKEHTK